MGRPPKDIRVRRDTRSGRYLVGYLEESGRYPHTSPETNEAKAIAWARRNKGRLLSDQSKPLTLEPFLVGFFDRESSWVQRMMSKGHHFTDKYLQNRQGHLDKYIKPVFGGEDPRKLTGRYIDDKILAAQRASGAGKPLAPATKYKILYTLGIVLQDLSEQGVIEKNPLEGIRPYSKAPVAPRNALPSNALDILFPASHGALVRVWGDSMWASCMLVLLDSGARPGELRALRWKNLYADESAFVIREGIESGTVDKIKGTKTETARAGALTKRTLQELEIWRAESRYNSEDDLIFTLNGQVPVTNEGITKAFRRGLAFAGIEGKGWTPYWLRHTFVTYAMKDLGDDEVLLLAGHTNIATDAMYRHPSDEIILQRSREAREKLEKARGKAKR